MTNLSSDQQIILQIVKEGNGKAAFYTSQYERDKSGNDILGIFKQYCSENGLACGTAKSQIINGLIRRGMLEKVDSTWRAITVKLPENKDDRQGRMK